MTRPEPAVEGLRRHAQQRSDDARDAIDQAIRELRRHHQDVNVNAVARCAGVSRKTIYKHTDLLEKIRNHRRQPRIVPAGPAPVAGGNNPIVAALRNELANQKTRYETEIARLKAQLRQREDELAAVHGELHRQATRARARPAQETTTPPAGSNDS